MRGPQYAWANSRRLQAALAEARESNTATTRARADHRATPAPVPRGRPARRRQALANGTAPEYVKRYTREILDRVDLDPVVAAMPAQGRSGLFCVERDPEACHRSLIAARLTERPAFRSRTCAPEGRPSLATVRARAPRIAQLVEHFHGKEGVVGSSPTPGLRFPRELHFPPLSALS